MTCLPKFFSFFLLALLLPPASTGDSDCPNHCGNVSFSYPFGVGSDCSLEKSFNITCIDSKTYVHNWDSLIEVVEINPTQIRVKTSYFTFQSCFNLDSGNLTRSPDWHNFDFSDGQYSLSEDNWLTGLSCDDFLVSRSYVGNTSYLDACLSFCSKGNSTGSGHCPKYGDKNSAGDGCCRTPVPKGTKVLYAYLIEQTKTRRFPCSYAFFNEKQSSDENPQYSYNYSVLLEHATPYMEEEKPVVRLDWRIGNWNCSEAKRNLSNYVCQDNTDCVDFGAKIGGYLCNCSKGYEGNPYLHQGCTDIDECADTTTNTCHPNSHCINTKGSYQCSCSNGYSGDGKSGYGCIPVPPSTSKVVILIGLGSGSGFLLLLLMCLWLYRVLQKRKIKIVKEKFFKRNGGLLLQQQTNEGVIGKTKVFPSKELDVATDHFNESRILGQGGQGTVYKGMLSDGKIVAVKKSKLVEENNLEQFINEVAILSQVNHRNVVKLLGCCLETEVPLLVYEFMPNGTLFDLIHDPNNEFPFTWNIRLKIAADIAGALAYLHYASSIPIYHRDIKSSNILLDEKYVVKVSDFGTSRTVSVDQTHLTTLVKGTFGYLDPEYFQSSQFTEKSDVYSFGVVLVELLTRQRAISLERTYSDRSLATRFLTCMEGNCLDSILDSDIWEDNKTGGAVILVARLAQRCLNLQGKMRPTMKEVATELESLRTPNVVKDNELEEVNVYKGQSLMTSDAEYTWTSSSKSDPRLSSDSHPLVFGTE